MAKKTSMSSEHVHHHRDGSIWARGEKTAEGVLTGYWEWFRKDGSKMRSGYFEDGEQAGEWTTYDRKGKVVKVTQMKGKGEQKPAAKNVVKRKSTVKKKAVKKKSVKSQRAKS